MDLVIGLPTSLLLVALGLSVFGVGARIAGFVFGKGVPMFVSVMAGLFAAIVVAPLLSIGFGIVASGSTPVIRLLLAACVAAAAWLIVYLDRVLLAAMPIFHQKAGTGTAN
ncbi:hypothetical protein GOEFS_109_00140 [Gordonia effusa NBRC 100432]|uniref:Uncharacterized protein n=1 Tax=Gordonia effusa NBRC 100432 TaxID=1077974 RepID=H0R5B8_9ACTN|nr:hypothetical protein [Gordonia effusa]GAB20269.1 hypothetical protein GOEFS_109_00140 [Gordonia effusa NBRC 100432]